MTDVGSKWRKRKADTETHAPRMKQVATDGTRGCRSARGRRSRLGSHVLWNIVISWLVISMCVYNIRAALGFK